MFGDCSSARLRYTLKAAPMPCSFSVEYWEKVRSETQSFTILPSVLVGKASNGSGPWSEQMLSEGVQRYTITYNVAISACEKGVGWQNSAPPLSSTTRLHKAP